MKMTQTTLWLAFALLLAGGGSALAQSNGVPGPQEYTAFSHFITDRNIFDPTRQPHIYSSGSRPIRRTRTRAAPAPGIQFVGTMSYEKGVFAFFSGNSTELSKVLQVGDKIAGFTITDISLAMNSVSLESPDRKVQVMRIGEGLRQQNNKWVFANARDLPAEASGAATPASSSDESDSSTSATPAAPASTGEPNDVLKRLMQLREKENQ